MRFLATAAAAACGPLALVPIESCSRRLAFKQPTTRSGDGTWGPVIAALSSTAQQLTSTSERAVGMVIHSCMEV